MGPPVVLALLLASRAVAQCPDGTPPPCPGRRGPPSRSVAVLYFASLSRDTNDVLLADGFTEELNVRLAQVDSVLVRSRGLVQRYRGSTPDPIAVGRALNTAYVVSGTFRRGNDRVRVTAELARASDGAQVWADVFERSSADLLEIEGDLARAVAGAIAGRLKPSERALLARRPTAVPAAFEAYLRGNVLISRRYVGKLPEAVAAYREAVRLDPGFASAWGRLAEALVLTPLYDRRPDARGVEDSARQAADRAMALDSLAAESWIARGMTRTRGGYGPESIDAFFRAVALDSNLAEARYLLGASLNSATADAGSAERHLLAAHRLDPSLPNAVQRLTILTWRQGRWFASLAWLDTLAASAPDVHWGPNWAETWLDIHVRLGDTAAARRGLGELRLRRSTDSAWVMAIAARTQLALGDTAAARASLAAARAAMPAAPPIAAGASFAGALAALGQADEALAILERYRATDDPELWHFLRAPYFEPLRRDPRFIRMMEAVWPR